MGAVVGVIVCMVGFTTTYAMGVYHHQGCEFDSRS
jgi:hypothetical protein